MYCSSKRAGLRIGRLLLTALPCVPLFSVPAWCQDSSADQNMARGNRAELAITLRDSSGQPITAAARITLYRRGVPAGQE